VFKPFGFPLNDNDVKAFVYSWFAAADHDGDYKRLFSFLDPGGFEIKIPGLTLTTTEGVDKWRQAVRASLTDEGHDIDSVCVTRRNDGRIVADIKGRWIGREKGKPFERPFRQVWSLTSSEQHPLLLNKVEFVAV
jgi:hypothetical protein